MVRQKPGDVLGPDDWVRAALRTLADHGIAAVRVEPLARGLGVTKGSFYWHFADHAALLSAMRLGWERIATLDIMRAVEDVGGDARQRLLTLTELSVRTDGRLDMAMRAWAQTDHDTAAILARVDGQRLDYVRGLFTDLGLSAVEAAGRARLLYAAVLGTFILGGSDADSRLADARRTHALVTGFSPENLLAPP